MTRRLERGGLSAVVLASFLASVLALTASCSKKTPSETKPGAPSAKPTEKVEAPAADTNPSTTPSVGNPIRGKVTLKIGAGSKLSGPRGVAVDKDGNVYVADVGNKRIVKFDPSGREVLRFGKGGSAPSDFEMPWKVAVSKQGTVLVLDAVRQYVLAFGPDGKYLSRSGGPSVALYSPGGLAVTGDGTPLVADTGGNRLVLLGPEGKPALLSIMKVGKEALGQPPDVAVDNEGNFLALSLGINSTKGRLMRMSPSGALMAQWTVVVIPSTRDTPRMVVAPDGQIVMTDPTERRIVVYSADVSKVRPVALPEPFKLLSGLALDSQGRYYVSDAEANLIYRLELEKGD